MELIFPAPSVNTLRMQQIFQPHHMAWSRWLPQSSLTSVPALLPLPECPPLGSSALPAPTLPSRHAAHNTVPCSLPWTPEVESRTFPLCLSSTRSNTAEPIHLCTIYSCFHATMAVMSLQKGMASFFWKWLDSQCLRLCKADRLYHENPGRWGKSSLYPWTVEWPLNLA